MTSQSRIRAWAPRRFEPATADPRLVDAVARFIADYRDCGLPPAKTQEAVLGTFPRATSADYAIGLAEANRRQRADIGNG